MLEEVVDTFQANNGYPTSQTGQVYSAIYPCNGTSVDWEYSDTAGKFVTYAFICELGTTDFWYGWNDSGYVENECSLNIPNLYYLTRVTGTCFDGVAVTLDDSAFGNDNCQLGPGESSGIWFTIRNRAIHPMDSAYAISAKLLSGDAGVQVLDSGLPFPNAARGSSVDNRTAQFHVRASDAIALGTRVPLRLELSFSDAGHRYSQPVDFEITIGTNRFPVTRSTAPLYPSRLTAAPNPARSRVSFSTAPVSAAGRLDVFAPDGSRVTTADVAGPYTWDCGDVPAGVYFCRLAAIGNNLTTRVSVVR